jgi:hypothetical protein
MENVDAATAIPSDQTLSAEQVVKHEAREIDEVVERLSEKFPQEQPDRIRAVVDAAHEQFAGNPIRDFVPVFVERAAKDVLDRPAT